MGVPRFTRFHLIFRVKCNRVEWNLISLDFFTRKWLKSSFTLHYLAYSSLNYQKFKHLLDFALIFTWELRTRNRFVSNFADSTTRPDSTQLDSMLGMSVNLAHGWFFFKFWVLSGRFKNWDLLTLGLLFLRSSLKWIVKVGTIRIQSQKRSARAYGS